MRLALASHDSLLRRAIGQHGGFVFKTVGDAFCAAFVTASDALVASIQVHRALIEQPWPDTGPIRVRIALHTGDAELRDDDYFGPTVNRVARLLAIGYGGQTLFSKATFELVRDRLPDGVSVRPLGSHRLKDLNRAEEVYQVDAPGLRSEFPALKSLDSLPTNLPIQLTSFIGRERELEEIKHALASSRLVTLLGPGGAGKSRLTLQAGADLVADYPDGVWFVELAPITDPATVAEAVAEAAGVKEAPGRNIAHTLVEMLRPRAVLIILDNCEHLLTASARLAQSLLGACPHVKILCSSREALNLPGETVYRVPPLRQPDPAVRHTVADLTQFEAVRLFVDRATSVNAGFAVTNANAPALAEICARLDGIPLAIELAAARCRSMAVEEINDKLDNCFRILTGGSRTALPRQQTLRALIDWSYDLLSEHERTLLHRISVFSGGWTLEAAEAVTCGSSYRTQAASHEAQATGQEIEEWEVLDLLTSLVDKSLAMSEQMEERSRYRMLETIRQYSRDRLKESGEEAEAHGRHLAYFVGLAEHNSALKGAEGQRSFVRLDREIVNLRSALDWGIENDPPAALRLAAALGYFYYLGGYLREGRDYLERSLAAQKADPPTDIVEEAVLSLGRLAIEQADFQAAQSCLTRAIELAEESGNKRCTAAATSSLGIAAIEQGHLDEARMHFERSLELQSEIGNPQGIAVALNGLGSLNSELGDYDAAHDHFARCLGIYRELGELRGVASCLLNLGGLCNRQQDSESALSFLEQALANSRELGDTWYIAYVLTSTAGTLVTTGDYSRARTLAEEALPLLRSVGSPVEIAETLEVLGQVAMHEGRLDEARDQLAESTGIRLQMGKPGPLAAGLESFADLALASAAATPDTDSAGRSLRRAATLQAAAEAILREGTGTPSPLAEARRAKRSARIRSSIDAAAYDEAAALGAAMDRREAVAYALDPQA